MNSNQECSSLFSLQKQGDKDLGLAVVRRLVDASGGTVNFESQTGKGTTFVVILPLNKDKNAAAAMKN